MTAIRNFLSEYFLPCCDDPAARFRVRLTFIVSLAIASVAVLSIVFWKLNGDLEPDTPAAGAALIFILALNLRLAKSRSHLALRMLIGLLVILLAADLAYYGIGSSATAGLLIPILLAAVGGSRRSGVVVAIFCSLLIWALAAEQAQGWLGGATTAADESLLTFDAPAMTAVFLISAWIGGMRRPEEAER